MNKNPLSFFCFLFLALNIQAQDLKGFVIDSLEHELSIHPEEDSTMVLTLNNLAFAYFKKDLTKTIECLEKSRAIAKTVGYKRGEAKSLYIRGMARAVQTKYKEGVEYLEEALQLYQEIDYKTGMDKCYTSMGVYFYKKNEYRKAIEQYSAAVKVKEEAGIKKGMATSLRRIGLSYSYLNEYEEAIGYCNKSLKISEEENNEQSMSDSYTSIGNIYSSKGNYPLSLEYHNKALSIEEKNENDIGVAKSLNNIGIIYQSLENYDKAIVYFEKALPISKKVGYQRTIGSILNNLGLLHKGKKNYEKSHEYLKEAVKLNEEINNKYNLAVNLNNIGGLHLDLNKNELAYEYFERAKKINLEIENQRGVYHSYVGIAMGNINQKKYDKALANMLKSKAISDELEVLNHQRNVSELLSEIYEKTGQYEKAFASHQQFKILNDSIFNKENIEKITQLEYEYKYQQALDSASIRELELTKTVETTAQNLEKTQRNYLLAIIGFLLISMLLGSVIFYQKFRNIKSKNQNIATEQKLLRSQMTPHFIFNSLSVLQGMILNREDKKSVSYLSKFSKLLRIILENSRDKVVMLEQEMTAVENYLALHNLENESYEYSVSVDDSIDKSLFKIPPMLIQPFVENAIEHAFSNQQGKKKIEVYLKYINEELICTITDNGIGIDFQEGNKGKEKKSLATTITSERLKILSKDFKMKGSVMIENREKYTAKGTIVTLVIPYLILVK